VVALPCGLDPQQALEQLFAADPALARPVPRLDQTLARGAGRVS